MNYLNNEIYSTIFAHKQILEQEQLALLIMVWKVWDILDLKSGTLCHLILETLETMKNLRGKLSVGLLKVVLVSYVLIISLTLCMSISIIFKTSHSEVLWKMKIVTILAGYITMASSALKCYSWLPFLCVF